MAKPAKKAKPAKASKASKVAKPIKKVAAKKVSKPVKATKPAKPAKAAKPVKKVGILKSAVKKIANKVKELSAKEKAKLKAQEQKKKQLEAKAKKDALAKAKKEKDALKKLALKAKAESAKKKADEVKRKKLEAQKKKDEVKNKKDQEKQAKKQAKEQKKLDKIRAKEEEKEKKRLDKLRKKGLLPEDEGVRARPTDDDDDDDAPKGRKSANLFDEDGEVDDFDFSAYEDKPKRSEFADLTEGISEEIAKLAENFDWKEIQDAIVSLSFFIDDKNDECMEKSCDNLRTTQNYCRLHYIKNYKILKRKKEILKEGKLQEYITELVSKYPPKVIEQMLHDFSDDREFYKVLNELGVTNSYAYEEAETEAAEFEQEDDEAINEARNIVTSRLDFDDEEM